jgi:alginate O-acetyltransferase complex protein AlgI
MTLGEWFKENVYFPLGGSRCRKGRTIFNLCAVWFCTGVWHALCFGGTGLNFMIWASFLLFFILLEKLGTLDFIIKNKVLSHIYLPAVILISWAIFNTNILTLSDLGVYFTRLFPFFLETPEYVDPTDWIRHLNDVGAYIAVSVLFLTPLPRRIYEKYKNIKPLAIAVMLALFWLSVYLIFCEGANPMVY